MANLTISVNDEVLKRARIRALEDGAAHAARTGLDRGGAFSNVSGCANHQRSDQQRHQTQYRRQDLVLGWLDRGDRAG